jgi:hypothetical protein
MNPVDRVADACLRRAARRWPPDLAATVTADWRAELDALRADPVLRPLIRWRRTLAFAGSLALWPAVEAAGDEPAFWRDRFDRPCRAFSTLAGAAGVALLAGALSNEARRASVLVGSRAALVAVVVLAVAAMTWLGLAAGRRGGRPRLGWAALPTAVPLGLTEYVFLWAGNRVAIVPFMGWMDIAPAVIAWTALTGVTLAVATRCVATDQPRLGCAVGTAGGGIAVASAAVCGSLHAAVARGADVSTTMHWLVLNAGRDVIPPGQAMIGPLLLGTAFVVPYAIGAATAGTPRRAIRPGVMVAVLAAGAVLVTRSAADALRLDHVPLVYGFGFAAHVAGRMALVLLLGVLAARWTAQPA